MDRVPNRPAGGLPEASAAQIQRLQDLARPSRQTPRQVIVEDPEPICTCLRFGVEVGEVYVEAGQTVPPELLTACQTANVPLAEVPVAANTRIFKSDKRARIFATIRVPSPPRLADLELNAHSGDLVVLDGVRIVGNIGAIIRSAFALGAGAVCLTDSELMSIADRRLLRASRCYVFALPVVLATAAEVAGFIRSRDLGCAVFDSGGSSPVGLLGTLPRPAALVFGSERRGPGAEFRELAGRVVSIPMRPDAESLNVSVSVGIGLAARASAGGWAVGASPS